MEALISWLVALASGAVGGNVAGAAMKDKSLGTLGNSLAGILGGGIGGAVLQFLGVLQHGGLEFGTLLSNIAGGGIGGAILLSVVAFLKRLMGKKTSA